MSQGERNEDPDYSRPPRPGNFNHAVPETATGTLRQNGHAVCFHDLYAETFNPILQFEEITRVAALPDVSFGTERKIAEAD